MKDYSGFVVLLARQRSGTHALTDILEKHRDIHCFDEVFNDQLIDSPVAEKRGSNYFNFLKDYIREGVERILPMNHEPLFLDYLEFLRCFSEKRYLLLDVKYSSVHHITKVWRFMSEEPTLFVLLKKYGIKVLNLTRNNLLRAYVSNQKASYRNLYHCFHSKHVRQNETAVRVDVPNLLKWLELWDGERQIVDASFSGYEGFLRLEYNELFPSLDGQLSQQALDRIGSWLGLDTPLEPRGMSYKKMSFLPLRETIVNFDEVRDALRGTRFAHCLEDERAYVERG